MTDAIRKLFEMLAKKENSGSDYTGKVTRVEGNTAFVQFDGSDIVDTPVTLSINAQAGDVVRVRVANGKAWLTGNDSNPPNDSSGVRRELVVTNARIQKIETDKITGKNGWICLGDGTFAYGGDALSWNGKILKMKGMIEATSGKIGGWEIDGNWFRKTVTVSGTMYQAYLYAPTNPSVNDNSFLGLRTSTNGGSTWSYPFSVTYDGKMTATSGKFGIFETSGNSITTSTNSSSNRIIISAYDGSGVPSITVQNGANPNVYSNLNDTRLQVVYGSNASVYGANACSVDGDILAKTITGTDNISSQGAGGHWVRAWNSTTGCMAYLYASGGTDHGLYSNGFHNGSTFNNDPLFIINRLSDGTVAVPAMYSTSQSGNPIISARQSGTRVGLLSCSSSTQIAIYAQWMRTDYDYMYVTVSSSDPRLKENIKPTTLDALELINRLPLHEFDWKADGKHWKVGFIAPEIYEIEPELAIKPGNEEEGYWGIDDFYLSGIQTKAIQELSAKVTTLESEVADLKAEVAELKALLRERITNA